MDDNVLLCEQIEEHTLCVIHDLKNPLIGANQVLVAMLDQTAGPLNEHQASLLASLQSNNKELLSLISSLSETLQSKGKLKTLTYELLDLGELVNRYTAQLCPFLSLRNMEISLDVSHDLSVYADRLAILRVIRNLVDNAVKFSPNGSTISLRLWSIRSLLFFEVSDQGPGIPKSDIDNLFNKYWQGAGKKTYSACSGLGLYLSRQIVEAHGGKIWCDSDRKEGSAFTFSLPLGTRDLLRNSNFALSETIQTTPSMPVGLKAAARSITTLALLEHRRDAQIVTSCLISAGHEVCAASSLQEAIEILKVQKIDLIISDVHLENGGTVFDFLRFVKSTENLRTIPFVLLSINPSRHAKYLSDALTSSARCLGAAQHITMETFDRDKFLQEIQTALAHHIRTQCG